MNSICFDTSGPTGCVCLVRDGRIAGSITLSKVYGHNETLLPSISLLLEQSGQSVRDLTDVAFVRGPGSFTGLRIGAAVAYGLSEAVPGLRISGYTSLYLLNRAVQDNTSGPLISVIDARKKQVYLGAFQAGHPLAPYGVFDPGEVRHVLERLGVRNETLSMVGSGAVVYREQLQDQYPDAVFLDAPTCLAESLAVEMIDPAGGETASDELLYIRKSDAELHRDSKRG